MSAPVCLVTGAASGIGAATALRFAHEGWAVAINNFDNSTRAAAEAVAVQCRDAGAQTIVVDADVGDDAACRGMVDAVAAQWRRLDAVVNSAGTTRVIPHGDLDAVDASEFERVYRVNLIGIFQMTRAAAPLLRDRPAGTGSGCVINISSLASLNGTGSSIAYAASKGAVNSLTLSLARSLAPHVRVNAIAPGMVDDGLLRRVLGDEAYARVVDGMRENAPLKRVSQPSEVAELAWFIAARAPAMTGQVLALENGLMLNT
ncbi:3-oxoacyl-[acyl-carrier-protein] reductase FabG [Achromobacter anxifer]|uniref:3-oxoacyl-[acyl-carrier-protein] reductase FabG n=1 Tax=Achromobacter anxifer TaxID=1287737 RepID=A0A6S7DFA1_9BURK|nr:SDR family oxidoreductase [Achromobacter anxifer]CAB3881059.1 3-oxoacyl-[acyl-carrier-protein] reductase FabG [Achromobacter anxifer]